MISSWRGRARAAAALLALATALLAAPAVATPALAAGTASAADENWLMTAHQSNLTEIASGRDAERFGTDDDVRRMGGDLVDDHQDLDETVASLARKYDVFLPPLPSDAQQKALDSLATKEGDAYDAAWVKHEIGSHEAIKAANSKQIQDGEASDVVAAAREAAPVIQKHLDELNEIARNMGLDQPETVTGGTGGQAAAAAAAARRPAAVLTVLGMLLVGAGAVTAVRRRRAADDVAGGA
jgi:putative membrane protein